ncbi:MAG: MFS transporter [Oscillospiraceae bacterium]|nr:MFS transporter [Oscillospiraceae bacterium]
MIMFKHYNKDQKLVLIGACLYYMGLGGFIFNSQSTVLAAVRTLYDFPMTKISIYTTAGYATQIFASMLLGSVIFRLSQPMKKYYFTGMYMLSTCGLMFLALFADTPLFYLSRVMIELGVSTVSIIIPYIINQWITVNPSSAVGLSSACAGLGGMISNPLASFLFERFSAAQGIMILSLVAIGIMVPAIFLMFRKPVPENNQPKAKAVQDGTSVFSQSTTVFILIMIIVAGARLPSLFSSYLNMFSIGNGFSVTFAATLSSILMLGNVTSKFFYGVLIDKIGAPKATMVLQACVIAGAALFILLPTSAVGMCVGTLSYGMMAALSNMGINRLTMAAFGYEGTRKYQGFLLSMSNAVVAISSPMVGIMYDRTGSFLSFFILIITVQVICFVAAYALSRKTPHAA